jgi:D-glycero-D-manno-heptose 1,7-bisphosphate phosphatase
MQRYRAAVFLDRDGTVIEEAHYLSDPAQVRLIPGAGRAIAALNHAGVAAVLVTNQSGVARGYFDEATVHAVHARLDAVFYCPHLATAPLETYQRDCDCRKPRPGMVEEARARLDLDGLPAFVVGDKALDIELARAAGATAILVRTGYGAEIEAALTAGDAPPDLVVDRLPDAVSWILTRLERSSLP